MATRNFPDVCQTNVLKSVNLVAWYTGVGTGTNPPKMGTVDPNNAFLGAPVYVSTGVFTVTTIDGYPGVASVNVEYTLATPAVNSLAVIAPAPVQNANGTWTFTINCYTGASLTNPIVGDNVYFSALMVNTGDPYAG